MSKPTEELIEDVLLSCRYGEVDEVRAFAEEFGWDAVVSAKDERGNTVLHMCCGNGHLEVLNLLLPHVSAFVLAQTNENGSPPIHWAVLNNHVACVKALVELPEDRGGGLPILKQKNRAGRDAFDEALFAGEGKEEVAGWIEGCIYRIEGDLDEDAVTNTEKDEETELKVEEGDEVTHEEAEMVDEIVDKTEAVDLKGS